MTQEPIVVGINRTPDGSIAVARGPTSVKVPPPGCADTGRPEVPVRQVGGRRSDGQPSRRAGRRQSVAAR
jgi:hypothetical protein